MSSNIKLSASTEFSPWDANEVEQDHWVYLSLGNLVDEQLVMYIATGVFDRWIYTSEIEFFDAQNNLLATYALEDLTGRATLPGTFSVEAPAGSSYFNITVVQDITSASWQHFTYFRENSYYSTEPALFNTAHIYHRYPGRDDILVGTVPFVDRVHWTETIQYMEPQDPWYQYIRDENNDGTRFDHGKDYTDDIHIYMRYEELNYNISYRINYDNIMVIGPETFRPGDEITVEAISVPGFEFERFVWYDNDSHSTVESTANPYTFETPFHDMTLHVVFIGAVIPDFDPDEWVVESFTIESFGTVYNAAEPNAFTRSRLLNAIILHDSTQITFSGYQLAAYRWWNQDGYYELQFSETMAQGSYEGSLRVYYQDVGEYNRGDVVNINTGEGDVFGMPFDFTLYLPVEEDYFGFDAALEALPQGEMGGPPGFQGLLNDFGLWNIPGVLTVYAVSVTISIIAILLIAIPLNLPNYVVVFPIIGTTAMFVYYNLIPIWAIIIFVLLLIFTFLYLGSRDGGESYE